MRPEVVAGLRIVYDDDAFVVIDKPVGVAAHPSRRWTGPTVLGHLAGAGFRICDVGCSRAPGHRAAPRRGDLGSHGRGQVRARLLTAQAGLQDSAPSTRPTTRSCRVTPTRSAARSTRRSCGTPSTTTSSQSAGRPRTASPTTTRSRRTASRPCSRSSSRPGRTHQIRVHMSALHHPCVGDLTYGADPTLAKRVGLERQWLHAVRLGFEHPERARRRVRVAVPRRPGARPRGHPR